MKISFRQASGRNVFITKSFRHPVTKKISCFSLGTADEVQARAICRELEIICNDQSLWDERNTKLAAYNVRAIQIFFGEQSAAAKTVERLQALVQDGETKEIKARIAAAGKLNPSDKAKTAVLSATLQRTFSELQDRVKRVELEKANQKDELEHLRAENMRLHRQSNKHVSETLPDAVTKWKEVYPQDRARVTVTQAFHAVDLFVHAVGPKPLGAVRAADIDDWLSSVRGTKEPGADLSPVTRRKMRAYLSSFFAWATRKYDLAENPLDKAATVSGVARHPENIIAIRRLADLTALIDGLKAWPYWQALISTAILCGPRFSELIFLRMEDVFIGDGDYLRIASRSSGPKLVGTKTGKERSIPLEQTTLLPMLAAHIERRRKEQAKRGATVAEQSEWVFPSTVPVGTVERSKTPAGLWSDNTTFSRTWRNIAAAARKRAKSDGDFWEFGPSEWRHSFGTCLAQCGFSSLEVARMMGNSSAIAERFYCGNLSRDAGKRWAFKW